MTTFEPGCISGLFFEALYTFLRPPEQQAFIGCLEIKNVSFRSFNADYQ